MSAGHRQTAAFFVEQQGCPPQVVVAVIGEIDFANRTDLESSLKKALTADAVAIELDLSAVSFIDLSGMRPILEFQQECQDRDVACHLRSSPAVDRVLALLDELGDAPQVLIEDD
jgi:anti-anti-sigma factor